DAEILPLFAPAVLASVAETLLNVPRTERDGRPAVDILQRIYDRHLFRGATFAGLARNGRPLIVLGAADDRSDAESIFTFTQDRFDSLCLALSSYPLARAIVAANAVPFFFRGVTLADHSDDCDGRRRAYGDDDQPSLLESVGEELVRQMTGGLASIRDEVTLADAGTADNLALQPLLDLFATITDSEAQRRMHLESVRRVLLISVDGQGRIPSRSRDHGESAPGK